MPITSRVEIELTELIMFGDRGAKTHLNTVLIYFYFYVFSVGKYRELGLYPMLQFELGLKQKKKKKKEKRKNK